MFKMDQHGQVKNIITTAFSSRLIYVQGHLYDRMVLTSTTEASAAAPASSVAAAAAADAGEDRATSKGGFSLAGFSRLMLIDMCILAGGYNSITTTIPFYCPRTPTLPQAVIICRMCPALALCVRMRSFAFMAVHPLQSLT